ncbi:LCP family protein [Lysinibacillus pakistanensis]|uniref:LCP family protein n=1 Tax=Lysinibacillus pakistanensis TaxID=759811 RepID=A0AAX3WPY7_9BACI|nr:LCP family protein [Lysinibacillus pakistanensis]MDM5234314.1 LCP family protein [Lysinibacillus pakistanensis]WHY44903.1 LCP family protein [Lysinibacillus pakistanensis]WHY49910.1 LCP family protein [Lysinibacillus pakistanensis]
MDDKRLRDKFNNTADQELNFTKEDRNGVFEQIHKLEMKNKTQKKSLVSSSKKFAPLTVSLLVVGLCIFLFMPSILSGSFNEKSNTSVPSKPVVEEGGFITTLITVKSKEMDNRIYLNLLLTYSKDKKKMKFLSIPQTTYAPLADNNDGTTLYDKLLFAYSFGGAENVRTTVSKLLDLPIDYYAVIDLETISKVIDSVNGIDYDLPEDIRVRAITRVAFDFEKGLHRLNGEEIVALMMAATVGEGSGLDEENLLNILNAVMNKTENEIPPTLLKELLTQIEANASLDYWLENQIEINSIKPLSLIDGIRDDMIDGKYYMVFDKDFLNSISEELTTFN